MDNTDQTNQIRKTIRLICFGTGITYSVLPMFMLLMFLFQSIPEIINGTFSSFWSEMNSVKYVFTIFLPIIILLGIAYIKFASSYPDSLKNPVLTNKILRIVSAIISASYTIFSSINLCLSNTDNSSFKAVIEVLAFIFGFTFVILVMNLPQYFISKNIRKHSTH